MNLEHFDTILYFNNSEEDVFESGMDTRNISTKGLSNVNKPINGPYLDYIDPKLYASYSFGKQVKRDIQSLGNDYRCDVTDFGREIVVQVTHSDTVTGRSASKTFLIIFNGSKGDAYVKSHSNKYRSISGISQAVMYIKSVCSNLSSITQQKM